MAKKKRKKRFKWILIIIIITFFGISCYLAGLYSTNIIGYVIKEHTFNFTKSTMETRLVLTRDLVEELNGLYETYEYVEFGGCLNGELKAGDGETYKVMWLDTFSDFQVGANNTVSIPLCDFGNIHSHPKGSCKFSLPDLSSFSVSIEEKGTEIMMVICGKNEFIYMVNGEFKTLRYKP